ncbi:hypothetical protein BVRB_3g048420 [Beta vulgaris subsp. vulgaris]|nr:hypothetical protein BVRB_3g048420 [Beta vulgaris subsp. vulgaris]
MHRHNASQATLAERPTPADCSNQSYPHNERLTLSCHF